MKTKTKEIYINQHYQQALTLLQQNRLIEAINLLEEIIYLAPNLGKAYPVLGLAYYQLGDLNHAEAMWKWALALGEEVERVEGYLDYLKSEAIECYKKSYQQALQCLEKENYKQAEKIIKKQVLPYHSTLKARKLQVLCQQARGHIIKAYFTEKNIELI